MAENPDAAATGDGTATPLERIVAAGAFCMAFAIMASIVRPPSWVSASPAAPGGGEAMATPQVDASSGLEIDPSSASPHVGLELVGEFRSRTTIIRAYRAAELPDLRYSMFAADDGRLLAVLVDAKDVNALAGGDPDTAAWIESLRDR